MPEIPWRDANVTATCPACGEPMPTGRTRTYCSHACRQRAFRARHAPNVAAPPLPLTSSRTATGVYECPECGERMLGQRRCDECNLFE